MLVSTTTSKKNLPTPKQTRQLRVWDSCIPDSSRIKREERSSQALFQNLLQSHGSNADDDELTMSTEEEEEDDFLLSDWYPFFRRDYKALQTRPKFGVVLHTLLGPRHVLDAYAGKYSLRSGKEEENFSQEDDRIFKPPRWYTSKDDDTRAYAFYVVPVGDVDAWHHLGIEHLERVQAQEDACEEEPTFAAKWTFFLMPWTEVWLSYLSHNPVDAPVHRISMEELAEL